MPEDRLIEQTDQSERASAAARLFDIRRIIGGLFVIYGLIVGIMGLFDSKKEIDKAQGVHINLWTGIGMLLLGLLFLLWQWLRPAVAPDPAELMEAREKADTPEE
jgi:hypothetical protein